MSTSIETAQKNKAEHHGALWYSLELKNNVKTVEKEFDIEAIVVIKNAIVFVRT